MSKGKDGVKEEDVSSGFIAQESPEQQGDG